MSVTRLLALAALVLPCSAFASDELFGMSMSPCISFFVPPPQEGNHGCSKDFTFSDGTHASGTHAWTEKFGPFAPPPTLSTLKVHAPLSWNTDQTAIIRLAGTGTTTMELRPVPVYYSDFPPIISEPFFPGPVIDPIGEQPIGYRQQLVIVPEPDAICLALAGLLAAGLVCRGANKNRDRWSNTLTPPRAP